MAQAKKSQAPVFKVSVLITKEDKEWCAIGLEMDLRGYGKTVEEAISDLKDHVEMQISFCLQTKTPEAIYHPAEKKYWDMYQCERKKQMLNSLGHHKTICRSPGGASEIPFNARHLKERHEHKFELAHA